MVAPCLHSVLPLHFFGRFARHGRRIVDEKRARLRLFPSLATLAAHTRRRWAVGANPGRDAVEVDTRDSDGKLRHSSASPLLRHIGVLPEYRLPYRMTGTFTDPNDAGFIACMTAALALAFQSNERQRTPWVSSLGPRMRCGTLLGFLYSDFCSGAMLVLFLVVNVRRLGKDLLHTGLTVLCMVGVVVWLMPGTPDSVYRRGLGC